MLISMNWIRDFVDLPSDVAPKELADRFTITCAEVEGVERIEVAARGLVCAQIKEIAALEQQRAFYATKLDIGDRHIVESVTGAANLRAGDRVVFAPSGAFVKSLGEITDTTVAGRKSSGLILPGDAIGIALATREAVFLPSDVKPGAPLDPALFDDWVIEIDNHSINHRPDLWGHYGIAREFAAICGVSLKPYPVVSVEELKDPSLAEIPIQIDDPDACPRYTGLLMKGVDAQPAPLWMQLRLGAVGLRPIDCLVDLTNYIMLELGQPMHGFDGDNIKRIEVGCVETGHKFTTLDNVERTLPEGALMILSDRKPIALAGIMGGADTEISDTTQSILLESANFNPYVIRKAATHMAHRTDASARFEKSLDPNHTVLAIQRFVYLARPLFKRFRLASRLSDAYPNPRKPICVTIDPEFTSRFMGHPVTRRRITEILTALEFKVADNGGAMTVEVPSFRATRDIEIEVDIIEEIARFVGYNNIESAFPQVSIRALSLNLMQTLERETLRMCTQSLGMTEIYRYLWYDTQWCNRLGHDPKDCLTLRNPAAAGLERMRQSLLPGLLAAVELNRHHFDGFRLVELGSVYPKVNGEHVEHKHLGMTFAVRSKKAEDQSLAEIKGAVEAWAAMVLSHPIAFQPADPADHRPWEHKVKTATVHVAERNVGRVSAVPLELRKRMDEHLAAWSVVWAEIELDALVGLTGGFQKLTAIPAHPEVELDFSILCDVTLRYANLSVTIAEFDDPLLRRISFVDSYEGKSIPADKRAITLRARIGDPNRTLVEQDLTRFRKAFEKHLAENSLTLRQA